MVRKGKQRAKESNLNDTFDPFDSNDTKVPRK